MYEKIIKTLKRSKMLSLDFIKEYKRLFIIGALLVLLGLIIGIAGNANSAEKEVLIYCEKMQSGEFGAAGISFKFIIFTLVFFAFAYFSAAHIALFLVLNFSVVIYSALIATQICIVAKCGGFYGILDIIIIYVPICIIFYFAAVVTIIKVYIAARFEGKSKTHFSCLKDTLLKTIARIFLTYCVFVLIWYLVFCNIFRIFIVVF